MTQEILQKAKEIDHDIQVLENIKFEQASNHWVGFRTPSGEEDSFRESTIIEDFKHFIATELEKANKMIEEL